MSLAAGAILSFHLFYWVFVPEHFSAESEEEPVEEEDGMKVGALGTKNKLLKAHLVAHNMSTLSALGYGKSPYVGLRLL